MAKVISVTWIISQNVGKISLTLNDLGVDEESWNDLDIVDQEDLINNELYKFVEIYPCVETFKIKENGTKN